MNYPRRIRPRPIVEAIRAQDENLQYLEDNRARLSIIGNFTNKLLKDGKDLDSEIYNFIDANFWDLL
jgi:hypothetical protein